MAAQKSSRGWDVYWNTFQENKPAAQILTAEAADFVGRLSAAVPIRKHWRVLEFGSGGGYVAELLAPAVKELWLWDASQGMRQNARRRVGRHDNVVVLDSADQLAESLGGFDLIVVNSVIQYMDVAELADWLGRWKTLLRDSGSIVISDIPGPGARFGIEVGSLLRFSLKGGFATSVIKRAMGDARGYFGTRMARPLLRLTHDQIGALADRAGLRVDFHPQNLTYRTRRTTALLQRLAKSAWVPIAFGLPLEEFWVVLSTAMTV